MHSIEAKPIEAIVPEPMQCILDRKGAHLRHAIVDGKSPGRVRRSEERRRIARQIVPLRAEVIVDDVEKDHQAARVRGIDKRLEILRPAIGAVGRIEQHAVIAPVTAAREIRNRHQLDRGQAGLGHVIKSLDRAPKGPARREGADVELEESRVLPGPAATIRYPPIIRVVIDDLARAEHVLWLELRGGIRDLELAVNAELIKCAGGRALYRQRVPAVRAWLHRMDAIEHQLDTLGSRRPKTKGDTTWRQNWAV